MGKCSGGQQQRLRFALALLPDPDVIVLDEPTTGMDVEGRRDFWTALRADASRGRTILFATHYLEEADAYADRIVLVSHGKIVADGSAAQVKNLASGRLVSASLPAITRRRDGRAARPCPASRASSCAATAILVRTSDSDGVARHLLTTTKATDVEITARGLEDAFLALTGDHRRPPGATHERRRPPPPRATTRRPRARAPAWSTPGSSRSSCAGWSATAGP